MTLNILAAPTEEDAGDWDQATQVQECVPLLQAGRTCPWQHRDSARYAKGEKPVSGDQDISAITARTLCSITWMGSLHAFMPQFPSSSY